MPWTLAWILILHATLIGALLPADPQPGQPTTIPLTPHPTALGTSVGRLYVCDNGTGKGPLVIRFPTGAIQVIATEP